MFVPHRFRALWSVIATVSACHAALGACPRNDAGLKLPPGFCATVFADGIGHARFPSRALRLRDQGEMRWNRGVALLEAGGDLVERPVSPFLGFGEQLPAVFGMKCGALTVQGFHRAAVNELFHRHLPDFVAGIVSPVLRRCHYDYATE